MLMIDLRMIINHFWTDFYGIFLRLARNLEIAWEVWKIKKMNDGDKCDRVLIESIYFYVRQDLTTSTAW